MASPAKKGGGLGILLEMGEDSEASDPMSEKASAAEDMMAAIKSGDAEGVAHAFQTMYDLCAEASGGEYEDDELELEE